MRVMLKASLRTESANQAAKDGNLGSTIQGILDDLKPEAAYFTATDGKRTAYVFFDLKDVSEIPGIAEPWFLAFNAEIEVSPVMTTQDLAKGASGIEKAVKRYGSIAQAAGAR